MESCPQEPRTTSYRTAVIIIFILLKSRKELPQKHHFVVPAIINNMHHTFSFVSRLSLSLPPYVCSSQDSLQEATDSALVKDLRAD